MTRKQIMLELRPLQWREDKREDKFKIVGKLGEHNLFLISKNNMPNVKAGKTYRMCIFVGDTKFAYSDEIYKLKETAQSFWNNIVKLALPKSYE